MTREKVKTIGNHVIVAVKDDKGIVLYYIVDGCDNKFKSIDEAISFINSILSPTPIEERDFGLPPARDIEEVFGDMVEGDKLKAKNGGLKV